MLEHQGQLSSNNVTNHVYTGVETSCHHQVSVLVVTNVGYDSGLQLFVLRQAGSVIEIPDLD